MSYTDNQIKDLFTKFKVAGDRPPTPYEISSLKTVSPQTMTTLKDTYAKYDPNSIVDYLKSVGEDPSITNRQALGQKYGITNVGSDEGNTALLNAIKSGKQPNAPAPVGGTIQSPQPTPKAPTPESPLPGSVSAAATPTPEQTTPEATPAVLPELEVSKKAYTEAQRNVLAVTSRIDELNGAIDSAIQNKRDEIARSGGVVNESQLRSIVLAENAPLLAERKELLSERTQLVGEQNIAQKNYTDMLNQQKQEDLNAYRAAQLGISQEKVDVQSQQFQQKFEQAGYKAEKVNITDSAGNVLGQKIVTWTNPANTGKITSENKQQYTTTTSGSGGITKTGVTNVGNTATLPKLTLADGASPEQVMQSLISGKSVPVKGSTVPMTQQTLYNLAIADMLGATTTVGGRTPSGAILAVKDKETDIMNAYGLTPFDIASAKTQFKGMSAANAALLGTAAFTKTYGRTAVDNLDLALKQSDKVARSGAKLVNKYNQWVQGNFTPAGDLAEFETYIYTASREYAKVTSGGAKSSQGLTDSAQAEAEKLVNASQSPQVFAQVVNAMKNDMNNVIGEFDKQTSSFPDSVKALYGMASVSPTLMRSSVSDDKTFVEKSLTRQGLHYDNLVKEMSANMPPGTQPALDAQTGATVYATPDDIKNGLAIPL